MGVFFFCAAGMIAGWALRLLLDGRGREPFFGYLFCLLSRCGYEHK